MASAELDLEAMDDQAIAELTTEELDSLSEKLEAEIKASAEDPSVDSEPDTDTPEEDAGGAAESDEETEEVSEEEPEEEDTETDSELTEDEGEPEPDDTSAESVEVPEDDQSTDDNDVDDADSHTEETGEQTFEAKYKELMAPFRAAKREVQPKTIEDARRLMQMGADYSKKMELMKPNLRVLRTLEKAELLDPSRINFLIDLHNKSPEAIQKLLKDSNIDPMELKLEDSVDYSPTNHQIGDAELAVRDVLDTIKDSPKFAETVEVISEKMDMASRKALQESPAVIAELHTHIESGLYQQVVDAVANERMYGRLAGLSDLEAYYTIGSAMEQAGALNGPDASPPTTSKEEQSSVQGSGSLAKKAKASKANLRNRKRAASPTKGKTVKSGKAVPDFTKMTDDEIAAFDMSSL